MVIPFGLGRHLGFGPMSSSLFYHLVLGNGTQGLNLIRKTLSFPCNVSIDGSTKAQFTTST